MKISFIGYCLGKLVYATTLEQNVDPDDYVMVLFVTF